MEPMGIYISTRTFRGGGISAPLEMIHGISAHGDLGNNQAEVGSTHKSLGPCGGEQNLFILLTTVKLTQHAKSPRGDFN